MLPFLVIVGELTADEESRRALEVIFRSVKSDDDLWAWIDYLRLPADGWEGTEADMPELDVLASTATLPGFMDQPLMFAGTKMLDWVVPQAHAGTHRGRRISAAELKNLLKMVDGLSFEISGLNKYKRLIDSIKGIVKGARSPSSTVSSRKLVKLKQTVVAGMAMGSVAIKKLLSQATKLRMHPALIMGIVAYLETRRDCVLGGDLPPLPIAGCIEHEEIVKKRLLGMYGSLLTRPLFNGQLGNSGTGHAGQENGALFHLAVLALQHARYEIDPGDAWRQVIAVEHKAEIQLFKDNQNKKMGEPYGRRVDIVLAGDGDGPIWNEVKSFKSKARKRNFPAWKGQKDRYGSIREFFLDRAAMTSVAIVGSKSGRPRMIKEFRWYFHDFTNRRVSPVEEGYDNADLGKARKWLLALPPLMDKAEYVNLGYSGSESSAVIKNGETLRFGGSIKSLNVTTLLLEEVADKLLDGVSSSIRTEILGE